MFKKITFLILLISLPSLSLGQWSPVNRIRANDTEIRSVALSEDINRVRQFLTREDVNVKDDRNWGWTLLHYAAAHDCLNVVAELLLQEGVLVNAQNDDGFTPLHWAAMNGSVDVVELLLRYGANVDANSCGCTPLNCAASYGHSKVMTLLLQNGAVVDARDICDRTPLYMAANWEATEILLQHGASLYALDHNGKTPLHDLACEYSDRIDVILEAMVQVQNEPGTFSTPQSLPSNDNGHEPPPQKRARKSSRSA